MKRIFFALLVAAFVIGCAKQNAPQARVSRDEKPQGPEIVRLVGQHQTVIVTSGPNGPLYSAQTSAGDTIVANATIEELRNAHPDIYRFVDPTVAADARR